MLQSAFSDIEGYLKKVLGNEFDELETSDIEALKLLRVTSVEMCGQEVVEKVFDELRKSSKDTEVCTLFPPSQLKVSSKGYPNTSFFVSFDDPNHNVKCQYKVTASDVASGEERTVVSKKNFVILSDLKPGREYAIYGQCILGNLESKATIFSEPLAICGEENTDQASKAREDRKRSYWMDKDSGIYSNAEDEGVSILQVGDEAVSTSSKREKRDAFKKIGDGMFFDDTKSLRPNYDVYRGKHELNTGKVIEVAVKLYRIDDEKNLMWYKKTYSREVNNMSSLHPHKNVARFIGCGVAEGTMPLKLYVAFQLHRTATLADFRLNDLQADERHRMGKKIFLQICNGVSHLHENRIAHRDLKPSNILFSNDGKHAIISDFGISKNVEMKHSGLGKTTITKSEVSTYGGTHGWMPAEMIPPNTTDVARRDESELLKADIFSLALVGCHILCDRFHPFGEGRFNDPSVWHSNIMKKKAPALSKIEETEFEGHIISDLFRKMLTHEPKDRPSINEVLEHFLFWDSYERIDFIRNIGSFFDNKLKHKFKIERDALVLAFYPLPPKQEKGYFTSNQENLPEQVKSAFGEISESRKHEVFSQFREVMSEDYREKICPFMQTDDECPFDNSLKDLVRYIRNQCSERRETDEKTWNCWCKLFPKLLPLLAEITKDDYKVEKYDKEGIDLKSRLEKAESQLDPRKNNSQRMDPELSAKGWTL